MVRNDTTVVDEGAIAQKYPDLYALLIPLLRTRSDDLCAYLVEVAFKAAIVNTSTYAHSYCITLDGNKRPRVKDFARFLGYKIVDFAIPRKEISRAMEDDSRNGSTAQVVALNNKARHLFTKQPTSGEGGEVLLSLLAEAFLLLPQLFSKMALKTSSGMHVHGIDGIHVGVGAQTGDLAVYWGESKLHQNAAQAINSCFASLAPYLLDAGACDGAQERDLQLMRDGLSLNDPKLVNALKRYLDPDDPMFNRLEYRGLCLVGFDSDSYPTAPNSKEAQAVKEDIEAAFEQNKKQILNRVTQENIESFVIHIFCLPFPSVEAFRNAFRRELGLSNEQD